MKKTLIDSGPLIALFDKDDKYHSPIIKFLKKYNGMLITTWPVITEVLHMLDFNRKTQIDFLKWIERGGLQIQSFTQEQIPRLIELSEKYVDIPMDLADATLILASEMENIKDVITIDSNFYIYRNVRNEFLSNLFIDADF
jgi:predicted nucleic acid-binding protein